MFRCSCAWFVVILAVATGADSRQTAGQTLSATNICQSGQTGCTVLAQTLVGPNIEVSNVQCAVLCSAAGWFSSGSSVLGFDSGVVLGTGRVSDIVGPNDPSNTSTDNYGAGDPLLDALVPGGEPCPGNETRTCDAAVLEFDFRYVQGCQGSNVASFQYVFASDEYSEYVLVDNPLNYVDVFGFFLNGQNIAVVPGTSSTPVGVYTINCGYWTDQCLQYRDWTYRDCPPYGGANCNLFRNNYFFFDPSEATCDFYHVTGFNGPCPNPTPLLTKMDGLTIPLVATGNVDPTGINHIKLAIADVGNQNVDSNVFIKEGSFQCIEPLGACCDRATATCGDGVARESCSGDWLPGLTCDRFNPPCRKQRMLVLLDRTGSMNTVRERTQHTRCFDALERAKQDVEEFFAANPLGEVAVWTFRRPGPTAHTAGFVDRDTAIAALNSPAVVLCSNFTPLAESMCAAVDALVAGLPNAYPTELVLAVSSDGVENDSDGECFGPGSVAGTECGQYDAGSWQQLVCDKVLGHSVVMARYWGAFSMVTAGGGSDTETGGTAGAGVSDFAFFQNLAESSGGRFVFLDDTAGPPSGACCNVIDRCQNGFTEGACVSIGGGYLGDGSDCSLVQCAPKAVIVPTLSGWGAIVLSLSTVVAGTIVLRRRRIPSA